MIIGTVKEVKTHEYRVGIIPSGIKELIDNGHEVIVESGAGVGIGFEDSHYVHAGATIMPAATDVFQKADMIVKVKELQPSEYGMLRPQQILFTFLHLAPDPKQTKALVESNCVAIAYETITDVFGRLPILTPMSEIAGRMSIQIGMHHLEKVQGGSGILLSGVPGVDPAKVVILGGGVVGRNAARIALGIGAEVILIDRDIAHLRELDFLYKGQLKIRYSSKNIVQDSLQSADLVIGAVLIPGDLAPKVVTKDMLKTMKKGSVLVDVAIDQGGCFETSRITTHTDPTYTVDDIIHYAVANIPGNVSVTSTFALTNVTLPFIVDIANKGWKQACKDNVHLKHGANVAYGAVTNQAVSESLNYTYTPIEQMF